MYLCLSLYILHVCSSVYVCECVCVWYWIINHRITRYEIVKKSTLFLFDLHKQKNSQTNKRETALDHSKKQSWSVNQFPDMSQFADLETLA